MSTFKLYNGRKHMRASRHSRDRLWPQPLAAAPADMPKGLFHGQMVSWEGSRTKGVLLAPAAPPVSSKAADTTLSAFCSSPASASRSPSSKRAIRIEIITDHKPGSRDCYIRMLEVVPPAPPPSRVKPVAAPRPTFDLPRGDRTISGVIIRRDARSHHTPHARGRADGAASQGYSLPRRRRPAGCRRGTGRTRASSCAPGPTLDGGIEAYQVMWGEIARRAIRLAEERISFSRSATAFFAVGAITRTVSSPAIVPTTSGHSA